MLHGYRVLDLTGERGLLCGMILSDLGADVIQVEPPGGSPARLRGSFYGDDSDPEKSLYWWAYCRGKRGVTLDLDNPAGQEALRALAAGAHFLIESDPPGTMAGRRLDYDTLARTNPGLVYVSITPFGQDGPKAGWADSDITIMAAGGPLSLGGEPGHTPVRCTAPQAYQHTAAEAAGAAMIAHHERRRSGRGQHVDVAAQQCVAAATMSQIISTGINEQEAARAGGGMIFGPMNVRIIYPARDGYVSLTFMFGNAIGPFTRRLMEWIYEEGGCDEATLNKDWVAYADLLVNGKEPLEEFDRLKQLVADFTATKTKEELFRAAQERGLLLVPVNTTAEVVESEQLASRDYWQELEHPALGATLRYPGPFVRFRDQPIRYQRLAPRIGEHNDAILGADHPLTPTTPVRPGSAGAGPRPLADVKVLDFMWVIAGPSATRAMADYGATIVRVESTSRVETARTVQPFHNGEPGPDSGLFGNYNAGKLGLTLNLATEEGRAIARDLVRWADIVTESFSPRAMRAWGFDYESLCAIKPDLIMLSTCLFGQSGPLSRLAGYGTMGSAISGFINLGGFPERPPVGPYGAYTDYCAPRFTLAALIAALEHRDRTGEGTYIDQAQAESSLHFIAPALLDYTGNGRIVQRDGNRDPHMAPHGVYRAAGDDDWVAIAVRDDAEWARLCAVAGQPALASDARFATLRDRKANEAALDERVSAWTAQHPAERIEQTLQEAAIPASVVQGSVRCSADPQLLHRGHFVELDHPVHGKTTIEGSRFQLSRTPAEVVRCAPTFGRDNEHVLKEILGYNDERVTELTIAGALD